MNRLRRRLASLLARMTVAVDPDPPMKITATRRITDDYPDLAFHLAEVIVGKPSIYRHADFSQKPPYCY